MIMMSIICVMSIVLILLIVHIILIVCTIMVLPLSVHRRGVDAEVHVARDVLFAQSRFASMSKHRI